MINGYICNVEACLYQMLQDVEITNGINCPIKRRCYASKSLLGLSTADSRLNPGGRFAPAWGCNRMVYMPI